MAEVTEFETDQFLKLLTDALRAGPGSPQWHDAVTQLRAANPAETDEYRLLISAREHLESGREYRSVRAGPGFTRKVMDSIEQEASKPRSQVSAAGAIAWLGAALVIAVVVIVAVMLLKNDPGQRTVQDLRATAFSTSAISGDFTSEIPPEWKKFGIAPVIPGMENALHPGPLPQDADTNSFRGGGLVSATPFAADQAIQLDLSASVEEPTDDVVLQLFVTDQPAFDRNAETTTAGEFAVNLRKNELVVVKPDGSIVGNPGKVRPRKTLHVVMKIDAKFVVVEDGAGAELYAGAHGLSTDKPRFPGLRFLVKGKDTDQVIVQAFRVMKP